MKIILSLSIFLFLFSCIHLDKGTVTVVNKVHNVKLESILWGNYSIASSLLPGEERKITIELEDREFPLINDIHFYMVRGDKKVFLKTKSVYKLDADQDLIIEITDTTAIMNPLVY